VLQWGGGCLLLLPHGDRCSQRSKQQERFCELMVTLIDTMITWFYVVWFPMCIAQTYYTTITSSIHFDNLTSSITCTVQHWYESDGIRKVGRLWPSAFYSFSVQFSQTWCRVLVVTAWWHMDSEELPAYSASLPAFRSFTHVI